MAEMKPCDMAGPEKNSAWGVPAMLYVPDQAFERLYPPETALARGTLFMDLDKPFIGEEVAGLGE